MINGTLSSGDPLNPNRANRRRDDYFLTGVAAGQAVTISYGSDDFDTLLQLVNAQTGAVITTDDDGGPGRDSELSFTAQAGIQYIVRATSFAANRTGDYTLTSSTGALIPGTPSLWAAL